MQLNSRELGGAILIVPLGPRLDVSSAKEFQQALTDFVKQGHSILVVDMTHVEFMDSSGLNALVGGMKSLGGKGRIILFGIQHKVSGIFRLTRMDRIFTILESEQEALQAAKSA